MSQPSSTPPPGVDNTKGAVYANGQYGSDPNDFESPDKDWKWVKAMLTGSAAVNNGEGVASAAATGQQWVDPTTLEDAGRRFDDAQAMMRGIANNFRAQAKGIAGEGRAWQGSAAEAFLAKMMDIADWFEKQALRIHDGDSTSANPLPSQLGYAGNVLRWGQDTVNDIDYFYANWAKSFVTDYGDGVVHISEIPAVPPIMTAEMKKVMRIVVREYGEVKPRALDVPPQNTGGTGTPPPPPPPPPPPTPLPTPPPPTPTPPPPTPTPPPTAPTPPPTAPTPPPAAPTPPPAPPTPPVPGPPQFSADETQPPPPDGGGNDLPTPPNPPGITPPGTTPPVPSFPSAPGAGSGPGNGGGLPGFDTPPPVPPVVPPTFPGVTPPGGNSGNNGGQQGNNPGGAPLPPTFPGTQPPGGNNPGAVPPPTAPNFPGAGPGAGGGAGGGGAGVPGLPEAPNPDQPGAVPGAPIPEFPGGGAPGGGGSPGAGTPPMMPPMSPPQPNTGTTERPDSSGLVTGDPQDWELPGVPNSPEAPGGAAPGGGASGPGGAEVPEPLPLPGVPVGNNPGIDQPAPGVPGGGVPGAGMPPMMPPMSPPQGTTGTTERPDSSGLVTGSEEDWSSAELPAAPEAPGGAAPGVAGPPPFVTPPGTPPPVPTQPQQATPPLGGMPPMMPPMSPPQATTGATERPDSSGLVSGGAEDWSSPDLPAGPEAPAGAAPGTPPIVPPAGPTGTPAERPRAAGLIGADPHPWESASEATVPDVPPGTAPAADSSAAVSVPAVVPPPISAAGPATRTDALGPDRRPRPAEDDDDDHDGPMILPVLPFVAPGRRRRPERRSEAGELLSEEEPGGEPDATTRRPEQAEEQAPDEEPEQETAADLPPDHVALVQESDDDFDSWDSETPPWSSGDPAPELDAEETVAKRPEPLPEEHPRPRPPGQSFEKMLLAEMPIRSGGPDLTPEEAEEVQRRWRIENGQESDGDEEAGETPERRAADLLAKDDTQWGKRPDDAVDGVIG